MISTPLDRFSRISPLFAPMDRWNFHHLIECEECAEPRECVHLSSPIEMSLTVAGGAAYAVALSPVSLSTCLWCGCQRAGIRKRKRDSNTFLCPQCLHFSLYRLRATAAFRSRRCNMILIINEKGSRRNHGVSLAYDKLLILYSLEM